MNPLPVINPPVPFSTNLSRAKMGTKLTIRGIMQPGSDRFTIDLVCGSTCMQNDSALHISVRPNQNALVRNHYQNHSWGTEERGEACPIIPGQPYEIQIDIEYTRFLVFVNGSYYCDFHYRVPLERVAQLHISGDTTLFFVGHEKNLCFN